MDVMSSPAILKIFQLGDEKSDSKTVSPHEAYRKTLCSLVSCVISTAEPFNPQPRCGVQDVAASDDMELPFCKESSGD
jgi:hypothetical protein